MRSNPTRSHLLHTSRRLSAISAAVIAATILAAGLTIWDLRGDAIEYYQHDMTNMGVLIAEQTSRSLQAVDLVLQETRQRIIDGGVTNAASFANRMGTKSIHQFLLTELKGVPQAEALILVDANGRVVNYSRQWPVQSINVADRDFFRYFRDHDDPRPFVSAPVDARSTQRRTFYIVRRVDDAQGNFLGVVESAISPGYWDGSYRHITIEKDTVVSFVRRDGIIVARYPYVDAMEGQRVPPQSPWYKRVAEGGGNFRSQPWADGIIRIVGVH
ncbi:MAG: hypothetical protein ACREEN_06380, partial [Stellaceae bacterium]